MPKIECVTKGGATPREKPRVYFTCHPEDLGRYLEKVCEDLFSAYDCAVYYTPDMTDSFSPEEAETDLGSRQLFVVPVTRRLLCEPCRAMDSDMAFAKAHNIPILPFMMEPGLDVLYASPNKFGALQYLNPFSGDSTEIRYEEKLKKHLESLLVSNQLAARIRAEFDAYLFLSYRKKDRQYANQLMKTIHAIPECQDIAIWYDEFLTPGESFSLHIEEALAKSCLFILLVTPNILEMPDGKPNFVMDKEYPRAAARAKRGKLDLLPVEMVKTGHWALKKHFPGIPKCIKYDRDEAADRMALHIQESLVNRQARTASPEHFYLIGRAYLDGIDVEVDRERGIRLIRSAATAGIFEAMQKLFDMYMTGQYVPVDYIEASYWGKRLFNSCLQNLGEDHPTTISALLRLISAYIKCGRPGDYEQALTLGERAYAQCLAHFGEEGDLTLVAMNHLAYIYGEMGLYDPAFKTYKKLFSISSHLRGVDHPDTLINTISFVHICLRLGCYAEALRLMETNHELVRTVFGTDHSIYAKSLNVLAHVYAVNQQHDKACTIAREAYERECRMSGREHPDTLACLSNLSTLYNEMENYEEGLALGLKAYEAACRVLGEEHPNTNNMLGNVALARYKLGDYRQAYELFNRIYDHCCRTIGADHPEALKMLGNIAGTLERLGDVDTAIQLYERVYHLRLDTIGLEHRDTLDTMLALSEIHENRGDTSAAIEWWERIHAAYAQVVGPQSPGAIDALRHLARIHDAVSHTAKAMELRRQADEMEAAAPAEKPDA